MRGAYTSQRVGLMQAGRLASADGIGAGSTREILRMATLGGAQAAHVDHLVGSLTPGKRADIVVLNARTLNAAPLTLVGVDVDDAIDHLNRSAEDLLHRSHYPNILLTSCR
jgi:5-methylthioadenosine/S-adenosylhomocysteine deaminase